MMFKPLEGDSAVLYQNGVFRQVDLATRGGYLFARLGGGGYVRLYADGSTSKDGCKIDALSTEKPLCRDRFNRICDASVTGAKSIEAKDLLALTDGR